MTTPKLKRFYWRWHVEIGLLLVFLGLVLVAAVLISTRSDVNHQAHRGAQAYFAVCQYKGDLEQRAQQGRAFLNLTPAQRVKKYGAAFGHIPPATIRASVLNEERAVKSLAALRC